MELALGPGVVLPGADLSGMNLEGVDLSGARLEGCRFERSVLYAVKFNGARLANADFRGALVGGGWDTHGDYRTFGPCFDGASLVHANFADTELYFTSFRGADVRGANFSGVSLMPYYSSSADALNEEPDFIGAVYDDETVWLDGNPPRHATAERSLYWTGSD